MKEVVILGAARTAGGKFGGEVVSFAETFLRLDAAGKDQHGMEHDKFSPW